MCPVHCSRDRQQEPTLPFFRHFLPDFHPLSPFFSFSPSTRCAHTASATRRTIATFPSSSESSYDSFLELITEPGIWSIPGRLFVRSVIVYIRLNPLQPGSASSNSGNNHPLHHPPFTCSASLHLDSSTSICGFLDFSSVDLDISAPHRVRLFGLFSGLRSRLRFPDPISRIPFL
jgi:hypothetical protein